MAEPSTTSRRQGTPAGEAAARIAPRRKTADQRLRIQERLTMGLTVAHIARVEQLTARRVRQIIAEMLARREADPAAGFVQLQIARLSEAMIVARMMMMEGKLQAVDRMIKLTGELDRYHGFPQARIPGALEATPPRRLAARLTAKRSRREMASQLLEKIESAPGNGIGSEVSNPQDVVHGAADRARLRLTSRKNDKAAIQEGKFSPRNPLKSHKTAKESRSRRRGSPLGLG